MPINERLRSFCLAKKNQKPKALENFAKICALKPKSFKLADTKLEN